MFEWKLKNCLFLSLSLSLFTLSNLFTNSFLKQRVSFSQCSKIMEERVIWIYSRKACIFVDRLERIPCHSVLDRRLERFGLDNNNSIQDFDSLFFHRVEACRTHEPWYTLVLGKYHRGTGNASIEILPSFLSSLAGIQRDSISRVDDPFMKSNEKKETIVLIFFVSRF